MNTFGLRGTGMNTLSQGLMEDQRLLASAALFRQLHENRRDVYDVLSQFICTSITLNSSWHFNVTEITKQLQVDFGFKIPEAVVKSCLRNRLKRRGVLTSRQGVFSVTSDFDTSDTIIKKFESVKNEQESIKDELIEYVAAKSGDELTGESKKQLMADFYSFFINGARDSANAIHISKFIVNNSKNTKVTTRLNTVEEGLLLYNGIYYSSGLMNHEPWKNDFQLFLDTEVLFDAVGLNGTIHQKIFLEFNALIRELAERSNKKVKIELKYFEETKREIEDFFYAAEKLVQKNQQPDPHRSGMLSIVNGCKFVTDVVAKKSYFFDKLRQFKITPEEMEDYYSNPVYNMESMSRVEQIKSQNPDYENDKIADVLRIFTKINFIRRGNNNRGFESCGALLVTGKKITRNIAYCIANENGDRQAQFAYDIDFITERLWFRLNKGFGGDARLPTTFDVVARAQVILSAQAGDKVTEEFKNLKKQVAAGKMNQDMAGFIVSELRSRTFKPEDFIPEDIDEAFSFMDNDFLETISRNMTLLEQKAREGENSQLLAEQLAATLEAKTKESNILMSTHKEELENINRRQKYELREQEVNLRKESYAQYRKVAPRYYVGMFILYYSLALCISVLILYKVRTPSDTPLSMITSLVPLLLPILSAKKVKPLFCKIAKKRYKKVLKRRKIKLRTAICDSTTQPS
jgi:rRNA-processing protein FCF1